MSKRVALLGLLAALTLGSMSNPVEARWRRGGGGDNGDWGGWRNGGPSRALHSYYPRFFSYPRAPYYAGYYGAPCGRYGWGNCW